MQIARVVLVLVEPIKGLMVEDGTMEKYRIWSGAGEFVGTYSGKTVKGALDAMARDCGYRSMADAVRIVGKSAKNMITEMVTR
jgi:hypothetical protein